MGLTPLTDNKIAVDAPRDAMWTVSEVADRDGISKQAVSKRVRDLAERHDLLVERNGQGHVTALNVVQYDLLRERYGDPSQVRLSRQEAPAGELPLATAPKDTIEEANRRRAWLDMEKRRLELAQITGQLVRADMVEAAVGKCCEEVVRLIDRLPQEADAVALAIRSDEVHLLRLALKGVAHRLRTKLAKAFEDLQAAAPATDDDLPADAGATDEDGEGD